MAAPRHAARTCRLALVPALLSAACAGLRPLPPPALPPCAGVADAAALWRCVDAVPLAGRRESAFASTARVLRGDERRKLRDQRPESACRAPSPAGFEALAVAMPAGRAPLRGFAALSSSDPRRPIVVVVHGVFESKAARPPRLTAQALAAAGFGVVVPDLRWHGCLLAREWLPTLGSEEGKDLVAWGRWLRERHPGRPIGLVAFSLGSLSTVAALREGPGVFDAGAVVVSPPADLPRVVRLLDGRAYLLDRGLTASVPKFFKTMLRKRLPLVGLPARRPEPFRRFLEWLVVNEPALRGHTPESFLAAAEPTVRLDEIRRPLLALTTANDPALSPAAASRWRAAAAGHPMVHVVETPHGGHAGQLGLEPQWTADLLVRFFSASAAVPPAE